MKDETKVKVRMDVEMTESLFNFIQKKVSEPIKMFSAELDGERVKITRIKSILKKMPCALVCPIKIFSIAGI